MALENLTKITSVGISSHIALTGVTTVGFITSSDAWVGGALTVGGNITIGGTVTYEDVTNIDSVGIITSQNGLRVTAGGINVTGVSTFTGNVNVSGKNIILGNSGGTSDDRIVMGSGSALQLYHNGSHSYIDNGTGSLYLRQGTTNYAKFESGGSGYARFYQNGNARLEATATGAKTYGQFDTIDLNVSGVSTFSALVDVNNRIDVVGGANIDQVNVTGVSTYTGTAKFNGAIDANGTLDVDGDTQVDDLNVAGVSTFSALVDVNNRIDVVGGANIDQANITGILTATTLIGALTTTDACQVGDLTILNGNPDLRLKDSNHGGNNTEHMIAFQDSSGNNQMNIGSPFGEQHLRIKHGTTDLVKIQTDGKVGVGTGAPAQKVHITASSGDVYYQTDTNVNGGLLLYVQGTQRSVFANDSAFSGTTTDTGIGAKGNMIFRTGTSSYDERLRIQSDGNVGIARTINNHNTSDKSSLYDLSVNRESNNTTGGGLNKSLNVDNQYTVQTFRSTNTNRNGTQAWFDITHFRAWDINAKVIIQSGGTFTGDQVEIRVISSYNSALNNNRSGPYLEVKRTEAHTGARFTKVRIGCDNANRQPILQVYLDGNATHNAAGYINVTVHDYGTAYGMNAHRGEPKFATATTINETWEELDIDEPHCDYFNTSTTPAFSAFKSDDSNQIASGVYAFNSQILDRGGDNYNTSNGKFTAPCDGVYYFIATLQMYGGSSTLHARFQKNGTDVYNNGTNTPYYDEKHSTHANAQPFCLVELSTDDYVECVRNGTTRGMQSAMIGFLVR